MWQIYSVGFEAVLTRASRAEIIPKNIATLIHPIVAMYSSLIIKLLSWNKMSKMFMSKWRSPKPWFRFFDPSKRPKCMDPLDLLLDSRTALDIIQ